MKLKLLMCICILVVPLFVIAEEPPSLEHHQFYGRVTWDLDMDVPETVVASVNGNEYSSSIVIITCDTDPCTGKYGYDAENYLRVQGDEGDTIAFYVDDGLIDTVQYQPWDVTKHDVSISSSPVTCEQRWDCEEWSGCIGGKKNRACTDINECDLDELTKTEQKVCGAVEGAVEPLQTLPICVYLWDCTTWSSCSNDRQTRTCQRSDDCDAQLTEGAVSSVTQFPKPAETKVCGAVSGRTAPSVIPPEKRDVGEIESVTEGVSMWYYVGGVILIIVAIFILVLFFRSRSKGIGSEDQYPPQ